MTEPTKHINHRVEVYPEDPEDCYAITQYIDSMSIEGYPIKYVSTAWDTVCSHCGSLWTDPPTCCPEAMGGGREEG